MRIEPYDVNCQMPPASHNIGRRFTLIRCLVKKGTDEYQDFLEKAKKLAGDVNPGSANASDTQRNSNTLLLDALGGILAEEGWLAFINNFYGPIASPTPFLSAHGQIDIKLSGGQLIEVRSSFPRNGVKFAVCHETYNFKVIGNYQNLYKPGEVPKDFYSSVLFETKKADLLTAETIDFTLIGGATRQMMLDQGEIRDLVAEGDLTNSVTRYQTLLIKDCLDSRGFATLMKAWGYNSLQKS